MSYYDYKNGLEISSKDYPFYALIQAAMRQADTDNLDKLRMAWPDVWQELHARYCALDGKLPSDEEEELHIRIIDNPVPKRANP